MMEKTTVSEGNATLLTHCSRDTHKRDLENSADPDQMLQNAASDQGLHCLQIV